MSITSSLNLWVACYVNSDIGLLGTFLSISVCRYVKTDLYIYLNWVGEILYMYTMLLYHLVYITVVL